WARVYPQLADDYNGEGLMPATMSGGASLTGKLDNMLRDANVTPDTINSLGIGLNRLSETTAQMADLSQATAATQDYTVRVRAASDSLDQINVAYQASAEAFSKMAGSASDAQEYH